MSAPTTAPQPPRCPECGRALHMPPASFRCAHLHTWNTRKTPTRANDRRNRR
ncbi:hypothetical protein [Cellulosimicrobium sp. 22601]|uniref:hypothetical protein n=1 Tax=Cellulosimicrobium sp. 22601 TaxID=3453949 RepID=UPI003F86930E